MKLWILGLHDKINDNNVVKYSGYNNPYNDGVGYVGFIIRAEKEDMARKAASEKEKEFSRHFGGVWLDPKKTYCNELTEEGDAGIILAALKD